MWPRGYDFGKASHCLGGFSHTAKFKRDLDINARFQWRSHRHQLIGGDDLVALLQLFEKAGQCDRGQIAGWPKIERQPEIDERRKLVLP